MANTCAWTYASISLDQKANPIVQFTISKENKRNKGIACVCEYTYMAVMRTDTFAMYDRNQCAYKVVSTYLIVCCLAVNQWTKGRTLNTWIPKPIINIQMVHSLSIFYSLVRFNAIFCSLHLLQQNDLCTMVVHFQNFNVQITIESFLVTNSAFCWYAVTPYLNFFALFYFIELINLMYLINQYAFLESSQFGFWFYENMWMNVWPNIHNNQ